MKLIPIKIPQLSVILSQNMSNDYTNFELLICKILVFKSDIFKYTQNELVYFIQLAIGNIIYANISHVEEQDYIIIIKFLSKKGIKWKY